MRLATGSDHDLRPRVLKFSARILRMSVALPRTLESKAIAGQIVRSGSSVGAQLAEANRAKSTPDFISKLNGALQELDETRYWLDLIVEVGILPKAKLEFLMVEADELIAIFVTIIDKTRRRGSS